MKITLEQLAVFVAVNDVGSITGAAESLGLAQSSVSLRLRQLEEALALRLFDRHTRKLHATDAARELLPLARKSLADIQAISTRSGRIQTLDRGRVSIAASSLQAALVLPRIVRDFTDQHPGVEIEVFDLAQEDVLNVVRDGGVDFGIGTVSSQDDDLDMRPLWTESYCAIRRPDHPSAARDHLSWRDLEGEQLIGSRRGNPIRTLLDFRLARDGISIHFAHETSLPLTVAGMAAAGLGVGILTSSSRTITDALGLVSTVLEAPRIERRVALVFQPERSLSPAAKRFVEVMQTSHGQA